MKRTNALLAVLAIVSLPAVGAALYMAFLYAPTERVMGEVQRIFYFHLSLAWVGFLAFAVVFVCAILYLATGRMSFDVGASASAEIGIVFSTLVLITGSLWARQSWGVWWTWDPRLTTMLVLWLMYAGYLTVRRAVEEPERRARFSAVIGIVSFANVPIVFMSVRWWRSLHPVLITQAGFAMEGRMLATLFASLGAFTVFFAFLFLLRARLGTAAHELERLRVQLEETHGVGGES